MRMKPGWQFTTPAYTTLGFSKIIGATKYTIFSFTAPTEVKSSKDDDVSETNYSRTHIIMLKYRYFILEMM